MSCGPCEGTGFINLDLIDDDEIIAEFEATDNEEVILRWIESHPEEEDVAICACCGTGAEGDWHGKRGEHWEGEDKQVYAYNGGLPECS